MLERLEQKNLSTIKMFRIQLKTITLFSNADQPKKQLFIKANITNELIEIYS